MKKQGKKAKNSEAEIFDLRECKVSQYLEKIVDFYRKEENMDKKVNVSYHAAERIHERCGIGKKSAKRCTELALDRGQHYTKTKGSVRRWLEDQIKGGEKQIYAYGDKAYVFSPSGLVLITVLQMPPEIARCHNQNLKKERAATRRTDAGEAAMFL